MLMMNQVLKVSADVSNECSMLKFSTHETFYSTSNMKVSKIKQCILR